MDLEVIGDTESDVIESVKAYAKFRKIKIRGEIEVCMLEPKCYNAKFETVELKMHAVAVVNEDYPISIELIEAETWEEALMKHSTLINAWGDELPQLPYDLEEAKETAIGQCGFEFDVKEI